MRSLSKPRLSILLGLFFAISGANKSFVADRTQTMYKTLVEAKVPFPHLIGIDHCVHGTRSVHEVGHSIVG
jgi:hypothetical protein